MAAQNPSSQLNPGLIFDTFQAYQRSMALKGAIELDLFTHIADGARTAADLAKRCNAAERGIRILCDYLTIIGFLIKQESVYALTPDSAAFLNKHSPTYLGSMGNFLASERQISTLVGLPEIVRKGGAIHSEDVLGSDHPMWVEFARSMAPLAAGGAEALAGIVASPGRQIKVLDIAAGHGLYGLAIARRNPAAEVAAVDWANVLQVANENAQRAGVSGRYRLIPGSAFEVDLGSGYDLVLLPNFLHHFDKSTNVDFLKKIRAAIKPGGQVATVEFVPNDDRVTPPQMAGFSLTMLAATEGGDAYTFREFDRMFREAGFGESRMQELIPSPQRLILTTA